MGYELNGAVLQKETAAVAAAVVENAIKGGPILDDEVAVSNAEDQMVEFLRMLAPNGVFAVECITDKSKGQKQPYSEPLLCVWGDQSHDDLVNRTPELQRLNDAGAAVFIGVNEFKGTRRKANLQRVRAVYTDADEITPEQVKAVKGQLMPTMIIRSSTPDHLQMYWVLADGEVMDAETAEGISRRLVEWGGDKNATDVARLLRLPGFKHQKHRAEGRSPMVSMIETSGMLYTTAELVAAFPPKAKQSSAVGGVITLPGKINGCQSAEEASTPNSSDSDEFGAGHEGPSIQLTSNYVCKP